MIGLMSPRSLGLAGVFVGAFTLASSAQQQGTPSSLTGTVNFIEPLITRFPQNNHYVGRSVDVLQMKDGSHLVPSQIADLAYFLARLR